MILTSLQKTLEQEEDWEEEAESLAENVLYCTVMYTAGRGASSLEIPIRHQKAAPGALRLRWTPVEA